MSTTEIAQVRVAQGQARWLALEPQPVLAFLYARHDGVETRGTATLFCPAFGWEEMCAYRGTRAWALSLAEAGFPAATFGLPGTGDSAGSPRDPGLLDAWIAAVSGATAWLAATTGAERVCAIGIGLGGMLAYRALAAGAPIDDLILWGVPADGRAWLRELRAYARITGSRHPEDRRPGIDPEDEHEYTGFLLPAQTARELERLRLTDLELPRRSDRRVLLLGRDGTAPAGGLYEHLARSGARLTVGESDDYRALMLHPQEAQVPAQTIATTVAWLGSAAAAGRRGRRFVPERVRGLDRAEMGRDERARDVAAVRWTRRRHVRRAVVAERRRPASAGVRGVDGGRRAAAHGSEPRLGRDRPALGGARRADRPVRSHRPGRLRGARGARVER